MQASQCGPANVDCLLAVQRKPGCVGHLTQHGCYRISGRRTKCINSTACNVRSHYGLPSRIRSAHLPSGTRKSAFSHPVLSTAAGTLQLRHWSGNPDAAPLQQGVRAAQGVAHPQGVQRSEGVGPHRDGRPLQPQRRLPLQHQNWYSRLQGPRQQESWNGSSDETAHDCAGYPHHAGVSAGGR